MLTKARPKYPKKFFDSIFEFQNKYKELVEKQLEFVRKCYGDEDFKEKGMGRGRLARKVVHEKF